MFLVLCQRQRKALFSISQGKKKSSLTLIKTAVRLRLATSTMYKKYTRKLR